MVKNSFVTEVTFIILAFNQQNQLNEVNQHFRRIVLVVAQVHLPSWQVCYLGKAIPPLLLFIVSIVNVLDFMTDSASVINFKEAPRLFSRVVSMEHLDQV